ncbi:hypothetical protein HIM_07123 [Hirsutella minnesotensis 3608]|uniref:SRCR domain-containing protein n=1 Tax=Hirsutella minnesotensis 3608 TaxID=1043627 RepID=A0A0F7ZZ42_9HYPO|nr:hypothetical protein HIM_07123 [Hirsutella minnesotensis 3608]
MPKRVLVLAPVACVIAMSFLVPLTLASQDLNQLSDGSIFSGDYSHIAISQSSSLLRRNEAQGSACSPEGQWNCMGSSWQRCAAGRWSTVFNCASGTVCRPVGLTGDMRVEREGGGRQGPDSAPSSSSASIARTRSLLGAGMGAAFALQMLVVICFRG